MEEGDEVWGGGEEVGKREELEGRRRRDEEVKVEVGLEEVYSGCAREVRWERGRVGGDGVMKFREVCSK